ncbi:class I SAM-dependent methyltransferase [Ammoniphilus sp. YIM 78166]|uniref:class I SAM-dependent methyltransferase n=1 Tax=Ammoniphilus sp. YIM 78166 TaxID=1644106 RepID=UPI00142FEF38|nr:SAM-dependent methyltransferase [Ammoniphilus sp. YIM 78166]
MNLALYDPTYGYYSRAKKKVGKDGDFYTSSSVGPVFGEVLGDIFADMLQTLTPEEPLYLVEFGGGTGGLMADILEEWKRKSPGLIERIRLVMIEKSSYHRALQEQKLRAFPVQWLDSWESLCFSASGIRGIIYSNELLDAFPVYITEWTGTEWVEIRVAWNEEERRLEEVRSKLAHAELESYLGNEDIHIPKKQGFRVEINLDAGKWVEAISEGFTHGYLVTIDYGFLRPELYIPARSNGTLMCYRQHIASDDPLVDPGEKDITTHLNFSFLIEKGEETNLNQLGYYNQSQFLINGGILSKLQSHDETDPFQGIVSKRNRTIRQLIMPGGMGETFKVLVQGKGEVNRQVLGLKQQGWV